MASCLTDNTLSSLIEGRLSASELVVVESHIDTCDHCRKLAGALAASYLHASSQRVHAASIGDLATPIPWHPPAQVDEYRILHPIGQGQMGQVYKAHDLELDRTVALKLLRTNEPDEASRERFRVEARAIARLRHPAVVGIYRTGNIDGHPYIVSEFVSGSSLDHIEKPMPISQVLHIGLEVARGLAAAHKAGVLHRDIKPANIMLGNDGEIKLLDFGLAKLVGTLPSIESRECGEQALVTPQASLTRSGAWVGTPRYMAPEVWQKEPATTQSDIYSLGCVLYELCAGCPPHAQSELSDLRQAVTERAPVPLSSLIHIAHTRFAFVIMRCLALDPTQRPSDARALSAELERLQGEIPGPVSWFRRSVTRLAMAFSVAATLICCIWIRGVWRNARQLPSMISQPGKIKLRRSVAVLGFQNVGGDSNAAWISTALAELFRAELAAGGALRLIPGENVTQMERDLLLPTTGNLGKQTLNKIRTYLGVDLVLLGSYSLRENTMEGGIRIKFSLQDTTTGNILAEAVDNTNGGNLVPPIRRAGIRLRERLGIANPSIAELAVVNVAIPESPETARAYVEGLTALRRLELPNAQAQLESAMQSSPDNPLVYRALAEAYHRLGYATREQEAIQKAIVLSKNLSREDQLTIQTMYYGSIKDFARSIEINKALYLVFPDNPEYGIALAEAQAEGDDPRGALSTIIDINNKFPYPLSEDPRLDIIAEFAYRQMGDFSSALRFSTRAMERAQNRGAMYLLSKAQVTAGWSRYSRGEYDKAVALLDTASSFLEHLNNPNDYAWAMIGSSLAKQRMGRLSEALRGFESQVTPLQKIGNQVDLMFVLGCIASLKIEQGHAKDAIQYAKQGVTIGETNNLYPGLIQAYIVLINSHISLGEMKGALFARIKGLSICKKQSEPCSGRLMLAAGRTLHMSGDLIKARDELRSAVKLLDAANSDREASGARQSLAELLIDINEFAEAEKLSQLAARTFLNQKTINAEWQARAIWAWALLANGRVTEAKQLITPIAVNAAGSENARTRLFVALAAAKIRAASGDTTELRAARLELEAARDEADRLGCVPERFAINITLAETLKRLGESVAARTLLVNLVRETSAAGFGLYERKARLMLGQ